MPGQARACRELTKEKVEISACDAPSPLSSNVSNASIRSGAPARSIRRHGPDDGSGWWRRKSRGRKPWDRQLRIRPARRRRDSICAIWSTRQSLWPLTTLQASRAKRQVGCEHFRIVAEPLVLDRKHGAQPALQPCAGAGPSASAIFEKRRAGAVEPALGDRLAQRGLAGKVAVDAAVADIERPGHIDHGRLSRARNGAKRLPSPPECVRGSEPRLRSLAYL